MEKKSALPFLEGGGELGKITRDFDWTATSLGSPEQWPQALKTTLGIILNSRFPMFLFWGEESLCFYNDAYRPSLGEENKHPAVGKPAQEVWPETWDLIGEWIRQVKCTRQPVWQEDMLIPIYRNGSLENVYWTFSYSAVLDETGDVPGVLVTCQETTEKLKQLKTLEAANRRFSDLVRQAPVAIAVFRGKELVAEIANEAYLPIVGKTSDEFVGKPLFETLPEIRDTIEPLVRDFLQKGQSYTAKEFELKINRFGKDETCYFNFNWEPLYNLNGDIDGFMVVAHEVTEQVLARKKVKEREEELKMAIEIAGLGVYNIDLGKSTTYSSKRIVDWFGFSAPNLPLASIFEYVHQHDRQRVIDTIQETLLSAKSNTHDIVYRVVHPIDGKERHLRSFGRTLFNAQNQPTHIIGVIQEISEQVAAESLLNDKIDERTADLKRQKNLLDNILQNSSNGISVTRMIRNESGKVIDGKTILANEAAIRFTGLPAEIYLTKTATEIEPNIIDSPYYLKCVETLETGVPSLTQYFLEATGRWLELTVSKMDDEHIITIFTDITPIKQSQLQLERTVDDLKRSNQNLEDFASAASHDLKEPVRKIHFFSERLINSLADRMTEQEAKFFSKMQSASHRMGLLIDDLLMYSQVSQQQANFANLVDLNQLLRLVEADLDLEIEEKQATITVSELPQVPGNHRQLQQVFQNLMSNALKYSKPEVPPVISISSRTATAAELHIKGKEAEKFHCISVKDNGIGFEQLDAHRIFNVFTRLHGKSEYSGTGLGLAIVKKVVENHSGFIWAESTEGEGAVFHLCLPVPVETHQPRQR